MDFSGRRILVWFPYSLLLGSTVDTCLASVYEAFWLRHCRKLRILRSCSSSKVVDIHVFSQMLFPIVLFVQIIIEIPQLLDAVADVPFVLVVQILTCRLWVGHSSSHSSCSLRKSLCLMRTSTFLRYAEADPHGPALDQRDFAVAVCVGWSMSLFCSRAGSSFRSCSSSSWSSSTLSLRRIYPMVQTVRQTIDIPQLLHMVVDVPVYRSSRFTSPSRRRGKSMVQTVRLTMDIPQLLNTVFVVPVVRSCSSRVQTWRRQSSSHGCSRCEFRRGAAHHRVDELMGWILGSCTSGAGPGVVSTGTRSP